MTAEEWRRIPGWPDYQVSSLGRVVSNKKRRPHELTGSFNQRGYRMVQLYSADRVICRTVHRLVALAFLGETPAGMQVRHLDGDKLNCSVSNLAFGTPSQNMHDQVLHGQHYNATRTHCPRNHPYDDENTYVIPSSGGRTCRTCRREFRNGHRPRLQRAA
jgi:hypothetical protein